jgi:CheY-like chemotaxis protein
MNVDIAANGEIGVKLASQNDYDAILMDIRMPVMNGLDAAKAIREKNKSVPIIAVSANAYKKDIDQSLSYGMNAHLSKPINKEDLFYTLATLIK